MGLHLRIHQDAWSGWSVHGLSSPASHLPSLSACVEHARKECDAAPATLELLIDGFYMVVHMEQGWSRQFLVPGADQRYPVRREVDPEGVPAAKRFFAWLKGGDVGRTH
jgi:hypothetical protein